MKHWKHKLISLIANGEPVLLNWFMTLPDKQQAIVYIPGKSEYLTPKEAMIRAVLVPLNSIKME